MDILFYLIPLSTMVVLIALYALIWAIKAGQFDDLEGPAHRILNDDDDPLIPKNSNRDQNTRLK